MEDVYFRILLLQICAQFAVFMPFSAIFRKPVVDVCFLTFYGPIGHFTVASYIYFYSRESQHFFWSV